MGNRYLLVLGAGTTGLGIASSLARSGFRVIVADEAAINPEQRKKFENLRVELRDNVAINKDTDIWSQALVAIVSPGIKPDNIFVRYLRELGVSVISELDWACAFLGQPEVAVTGTNGKTTTVNLIHRMLLADGRAAKLLGNIGEPLSAVITAENYSGVEKRGYPLVCEISSFQLALTAEFSPHIAVWLNIEDDHIEWHGSFSEYANCKTKITAQQSAEDYLVINVDDPKARLVIEHSPAQIVSVGICHKADKLRADSCLYCRDSDEIIYWVKNRKIVFPTAQYLPRGEHNKLNLCAAIAGALLLGVKEESIKEVIASFKLSAHRIELVPSTDGIVYVDDSKGTNVSAVVVALKTVFADYPESKVVLILGGVAKEGSWRPVAELVYPRIKQIICCGVDGPKIAAELQAHSPQLVKDLPAAVLAAKRVLQKSDVLLLSPGCASFDAYSGYAARGIHFQELVVGRARPS